MQFGELLERVYAALGAQVLRRTATGGTTTTVVDTGIVNEFQDDEFTGASDEKHVLFISETTDDLSPLHEFGEVSAYDSATETFTIPTLTAAPASGDVYALMEPVIPLQEMISAVNRGLTRLPEREKVDTSLTTATDTLNYNLPLPVNRYVISKIEIGNNTDGWEDAPGYTIVPMGAGTQDVLLFTQQPDYDNSTPANKTIKITWQFTHPYVSTYADYIEKSVPDEVAISICADAALEYVMKKNPSYYRDQNRRAMYDDTRGRAQEAQRMHPTRTMPARRQNRINLREL